MLLPVRLLALLTVAAALQACGQSYETTKVKRYRLSLVEGDTALVSEFRSLIADYNELAGLTALEYVDNAADANSAIIVTKGLQTSTRTTSDQGKVGLGQWLSETKTDNPMTVVPGTKVKRTIIYAMRVEFDWDYMTSKTHYEQQKLFFHEVGHGLELDHAPDPRDVMYKDVGGDKDFDKYFDYVRRYMADT